MDEPRGPTHYVIQTVDQVLELWSTTRLPFEPKGWLLDLRADLRAALKGLGDADGTIVDGLYASPLDDVCDAENILFYNVGVNYLPLASRRGIRFERGYEFPPAPKPLATPVLHYHRYRLARPVDAFSVWAPGRTLVSWSVPLRYGAPTSPARVWEAMKRGQVDVGDLPATPPKRFGLRATVATPAPINAAALMKPVLDGVIAAFHIHDGSSLELAVDRLAGQLGAEPSEVRAFLLEEEGAVLGPRRLLWPRGQGVQWNPADDACLAGELLTAPSDEWYLRGELFELEERLSP